MSEQWHCAKRGIVRERYHILLDRPGIENEQRKGIGRSLYAKLLPRLRQKGFHAAFAAITLPNPKSIALHEAAGFTHAGTFKEVGRKFNAWHDVGWWQRLL